jgi:hypothetical protein
LSAPLLPHVGFRAGRLGDCALTLHPEKTRLIEFGRYAAQNRGAPHAMARAGEANSRARSSKDSLDGRAQLWLATECPALLTHRDVKDGTYAGVKFNGIAVPRDALK